MSDSFEKIAEDALMDEHDHCEELDLGYGDESCPAEHATHSGLVGCVVEHRQSGGGFWDPDIPCDCEPRYCPECGERMVGE